MVKTLDIDFEDDKILGNLHINKNSDILIILCHGYGDDKEQPVLKKIAEMLSKKYNVYRFTFTDRASPDLPTERDNIKVVVSNFRNKFKKIILLGASLGGLSTILSIGSVEDIDKLILINPFVYLFKKVAPNFRKVINLMLISYPFIKKSRDNINFYFKNFNPKSITIPTLFIVAENDKIVSSIHGKTLYQQIKSPNKKIFFDDNFDHGMNLREYQEKAVNIINNWLG